MTNEIAYGAGGVSALILIGWIVGIEYRLQILQRTLIKTKEIVQDAQIKDRVVRLSDAELNVLLDKDMESKPKP